MEFYIISSRETLDVFKKCKYFIHNLGMVSTVDKNGSRLLNDKDKFAFYFNNLYNLFIKRQKLLKMELSALKTNHLAA